MATAPAPAPPTSGVHNGAPPQSGTENPPPQHRLGRLVLAAIVLVAVASAFALNHKGHRALDVADWTGVQMNGATTQGEPIFAVERKGAVRAFYMNWRVKCPSGARYIAGGHFREPLSYFHRNGLAFTVGMRGPRADAGRTGQVHATVSGRLSADLRTAHGVAERTIVWHRAGQQAETCGSGLVHWHARLAPGLKPN